MSICTYCRAENRHSGIYCERCGATLPTFDPGEEYTFRNQQILAPPPPPAELFAYPSFPDYAAQKLRPAGLRSTAHTVFCTILYLYGAACASFGIFGALQNILGKDMSASLLLLAFAGSVVLLIPIIIRHKTTRLHWPIRLLLEIAALFVIFALAIVVYGVIKPHGIAEDLLLGTAFFIYGVITAIIALW